ncbi:hypothetical protein Acr_04g0006040 [Actinidia rufa]|uniref:Uncharacterized protein n=1 Tax=Actinidia rufa TaxID=165716 RepID=A0A7J0EI46_9ERIC|nr:hypothetical protein Acr_04g0006040 [Actinidia rufa]
METRRPKSCQTRCKKHPKHRQSPGVCSVCLGERLSQLSTGLRAKTTLVIKASSCTSSSSSSLSSLSSSGEVSPVHHRFRKSRSLAFVVGARGEDREGKKKGGFWSKLLWPRSKKMDGGLGGLILHSKTMRERVMSTRVR